MNTLPPELLTILDALGVSLCFWLALNLASHGWGWSRGRAQLAALAFIGLATFFGLAAWDDLHVLAGADATNGWLRLFLLFFPVMWLGFARRLMPSALRNRTTMLAIAVSLLALLPLAATLYTVLLATDIPASSPDVRPTSWYFLPAYLIYALAVLGVCFYHTLDARNLVQSRTERSVLLCYAAGSLTAMLGVVLITTDLVFGLNSGILPVAVRDAAFTLRLIGSMFMLVSTFLLWYLVHTQAAADGALHLSAMRVSLFITMILTIGAVGLTLFFVTGSTYTEQIVFIVLLFSLTADWFVQWLRTHLEKFFYRGESGALRQTLYRVLAVLDPVYGPTPPAIRPLINNLSRQLNVPQLGLAMPDEKDNKKFRIVVSTNPKWEGQELPVTSPDVWHERGHDGWNMPLRKDGRSFGMIASSGSRQLSRIQEKLLEEAAKEMIHLLDQWQQLAGRRQLLQNALDNYWKDEEAFERYSLAMVVDIGPRQDLRRALTQLFAQFGDPQAFSNHPLTKLQLIEQVAGSSASATSRGETLRSVLLNLIDQLRPAKTNPPETPTPDWIPFVVMHDIYITGKPKAEVMGTLNLEPANLKKVEAGAITQLAHLLSELESAVLRRQQREQHENALRNAGAKPALNGKAAPASSGYGNATASSYGTASSGYNSSSSYGTGSTGGTSNYGSSPTGAKTTPDKKEDGKKTGGLLGGLGGITSGLTQRFNRGDDKAKDGDKAKPKSTPPTGEPAKSGGFGNLFNRNKEATPAGESKPLPKPVEGSASLKERFSGGLSGLTSKFSRGKDDKAGADATKGKNATPAGNNANNATTKVNPVFTRQPTSPSTPAFGGSSGGNSNSGFVRAAPKPGAGGSDSRQKNPDPYDFPEDYGMNLDDEDDFNKDYDYDK